MYYYEDVDEDEMLESAALGLIAGIGDVYSTYYTKEDMEAFNEETEGEYAGIGCQLLADPSDQTITITRVFKGSPAERAGMRSGDKIVYVNDVYYSAYEMDDAVSVMRGEPGGTVKVTVLRDLDTIDFDVTREIVNINYVEYEILDGDIGYVMVYDFLGDAYEGFAEAIDAFRAANVSGMIIDLRNNGGGLVDACVDMADLILPEGVVVSMRDKYDEVEEYLIDDEYFDVPMVLLVNGYSASASEIFAGGILGTSSGIVIGTRSYGKGVAQVLFDESNCPYLHGDAVKVTAYRFYCAGGNTTDRIGVVPTLYIPQDQATAAARLLSGEKTKDSAYLHLVLNGCDFYIDIPAAKESSSAVLEAILTALTPDAELYWGENGGERKLTLAQAREKCGFAASSALDFSDVADSEYAQEIDSLAASRIVFGDGGKFRPDATMTRAEVCALLAQALDLYSTANGCFTDVAKGSWYAPSVNAMAAIGLVSGVGGGKFDPNAAMTQEEFITVLGRLVEFVNLDAREFLDKNPLAILQPLPKYKSFSHWAIRSVELLTNSVFDENGDAVNMYCMSLEDIEPQVPILREQAAAALYNALRTTGVLKY